MIAPFDQFCMEIRASGLTPPNEIIGDGKIHRFSSNGVRGDDSGWYALHQGKVSTGVFGCWRKNFIQHWCSKKSADMTPSELEAYRKCIDEMRQRGVDDKVKRQQDASASASARWDSALNATIHPYLVAKGVQAYGVKIEENTLLIPIRSVAGALHSLQSIDPQGNKRFLHGGRVEGCFHLIGKPEGCLIVCEGYATGASIHEATGLAVAVAFNAGNMQAVAIELRRKYPDFRLILAADDDWKNESNPGLTKAAEVARAVDGLLAVPIFSSERGPKHTDFNDLHAIAGLSAVKTCIEAAEPVEATIFPALPDAVYGKLKSEVVLLNGADLTPEPVRWLWTEWLALGKLHILAGAPGQGKTTIALACAATVTIGGCWPDASRSEKGNILIWSGEDDPADTLLPRLLAAGADKDHCYFVSGTRIDGEVQPFDPARDLAALEAQAQRIGGVKLLIVDPVVSAVAGDSHKNTEVRRALQPLVDLASRLDAAVVGISHFSKGGAGSDPASRVVGSIAFTAVARVVLVAAKVKSEDGGQNRRILARGKSNIGPDDGGFEYRIEQNEPIPGIRASYIVWGNSVTGTARELLADSEAEKDSVGGSTAQAEAEEFLVQLLRHGPCPTKHVESEAKAAGISWRTVRRASDALGIKKRKHQEVWYWSKPELSRQLVQDVRRSDGGHVGQIDGQDRSDFSVGDVDIGGHLVL